MEDTIPIIHCTKFNYKDGKQNDNIILVYGLNTLSYSYNNKIRRINTESILGLIYGCKTITFTFVKNCIPWRCFSLVTASRTYDFEALTYNDFYNFYKILIENKIIKQSDTVDHYNKMLWMIYNYGNIKDYKHVQQWFSNYKIIKKNNYTMFNDSCCICIEEYNDKDDLIILKNCQHSYHKVCINTWLSKENICPMCRMYIGKNDLLNKKFKFKIKYE